MWCSYTRLHIEDFIILFYLLLLDFFNRTLTVMHVQISALSWIYILTKKRINSYHTTLYIAASYSAHMFHFCFMFVCFRDTLNWSVCCSVTGAKLAFDTFCFKQVQKGISVFYFPKCMETQSSRSRDILTFTSWYNAQKTLDPTFPTIQEPTWLWKTTAKQKPWH